MNNEQFKSILCEYPMSTKLKVTVERTTVIETTVAEMLCKLMEQPPNGLLTFFGRDNIILRERSGLDTSNTFGTLIDKRWLEMDMR